MVFYFVETAHVKRPLVKMILCDTRVEAEECAAGIEGDARVHEVEASSAVLAGCKLVARHPARERDIRFVRTHRAAHRKGSRLRRL